MTTEQTYLMTHINVNSVICLTYIKDCYTYLMHRDLDIIYILG